MARVMAVTFERYGQLHYLDPGERAYHVGDWVLYPTADGDEVAQCVWAPEESTDGFDGLPLCAGPATPADLERDAQNRQLRFRAGQVARDLVRQNALPMKIVGVDSLDRSAEFGHVIAIYFTAPHRVDFRALLGDLARALNSRIDLRQVGARDAARLLGGIGSCGRELCCATFLTNFEPVSMRLAKLQSMPSNPLQIAGACGKLMCCLRYEHPLYEDFLKRAPAVGEYAVVDGEDCRVIGHRVPAEEVQVRTTSGQVLSCPLESVCSRRRAREAKETHE